MILSRSGQEFTFDPDCRLGRHSALAGTAQCAGRARVGLGKRRISWILDEDIRAPAEWLVELRELSRLPSRARRDFELILISPVNARGPLAARAFLIAIDAPRLGVLFWCRSQASQARLAVRRNGAELGGEPPASLIPLITDNKQAVVDALQRAEAEADRWRFVLREKSNLVMRARGSPEYESRCEAYGIILVEYLNGSMLDTDPRVCACAANPICR